MASPQKEKGHTDIANEIAEQLCRVELSPNENNILWVIWRKTYGWHKKEDKISLTQFQKMTGMSRQSVVETIARLVKRNLVLVGRQGLGNVYSFGKDWDKWVMQTSRVRGTSRGARTTDGRYARTSASRGARTHKRNYTKETITKEIRTLAAPLQKERSDKEIIAVFDLFRSLNPGINYGNRTQRLAASWLLAQYGPEKTQRTIEYALSVQGKSYAPLITTPYQLKEKLGALRSYYEREKSQKPRVISI